MANRRRNVTTVEVDTFSTGFLKELFGDKGKFATVNFIKKSNGAVRTLNGKSKAFAALKGGDEAYDAESRGQVRVADVNVYKDEKGNPCARRTAYRAVVVDNIQWVTSGGKKYVRKGDVKPELAFIQNITYDTRSNILRLVLSGKIYRYYEVPREKHIGLINAENKGRYFNENIKNVYKFISLP